MRKTGFTLIELLISITIIAILAALGLSGYAQVQRSARDSRRQSDLKLIQSALEQYHSDQHYYPSGSTLPSPLINAGKTYLTIVPKDPKDQSAYSYVSSGCDSSSANCTSYCLSAQIEGTVPTSACTNSGFNYGVTKP